MQPLVGEISMFSGLRSPVSEDLRITWMKELTELFLRSSDGGDQTSRQSGRKKRELMRHSGSETLSLILRNQLRMEPACSKMSSSVRQVSRKALQPCTYRYCYSVPGQILDQSQLLVAISALISTEKFSISIYVIPGSFSITYTHKHASPPRPISP